MEQQESLFTRLNKIYVYYTDKTVRYPITRWICFFIVLALYAIRIVTYQGFYLITYALGLYLLNLLLGFISPLKDPEDEEDSLLPNKETDEYKPFIRKLPEFKFWLEGIKGILISLVCTLNPAFDLPVFWPILVAYFISLCFMTLRQRVAHMIEYKYVPWSTGKKTYYKD
ncbi:hypothetical protein WA158_005199 [Blastocystis sp. Blastoise]